MPSNSKGRPLPYSPPNAGPEALGEIVAHAGAHGVALVLGIPETAGDLTDGVGGVVAEEEAAGDGQIRRAYDVGVADKSAEAVPVGNFEFSFDAVDVGLVEGDGEADGGAEELVVVGVVVDAAVETVNVEPELAEEAFGEADLVVVAMGRLDGEAQDVVAEGDDRGRTGDQEVFV